MMLFLYVLPAGLPDQGFEDSEDSSSVFSTPSPKTKHTHAPHEKSLTPPLLPSETQHASLRRKKMVAEMKQEPILLQPTLEKSQSLQAELQQQQQQQRPLSMVLASQSEVNVLLNPALSSLQRQVSMSRSKCIPLAGLKIMVCARVVLVIRFHGIMFCTS